MQSSDNDTLSRTVDESLSNILVMGETVIDFIPDQPGELSMTETFHRRAGGAPANVAVRLAELGLSPWFWTRVGDDGFGSFLHQTLRDNGLTDRFIIHDDTASTALAFVSHDDDADREFNFYRTETADTRFDSMTIPDSVLGDVSWVIFGGVCLACEPARTAMLSVAKRAQQNDCTVAFDPNARPELWDSPDEFATACRDACDIADIIKATPEDIAAAGIDHDDEHNTSLDALLDLGPHTAFITYGDAGAAAQATDDAPWGATEVTHEGYSVNVVDTTGAGDAFLAGGIRGLIDGLTLAETLSLANATAAITTTKQGAMDATVSQEAINQIRTDDVS
jgi:fructokinase